MKQKKIITTVLIVIVIGVWGYVLRNMYMNFFGGAEEVVAEELANVNNQSSTVISNDFELFGDYEDPFGIGTRKQIATPNYSSPKPISRKNRSDHQNRTSSTKAEKKETEEKVLPEITYHGMIRENESDEVLAVITVDKQRKMVSLGATSTGGIEVLGIYGDSIVVGVSDGRRLVVGK